MRLTTFCASIILIASSSAYCQVDSTDKDKLLKAQMDIAAWKPVTYAGKNKVAICSELNSEGKCETVALPKYIGETTGIAYGISTILPSSWLAFGAGKINLCEKGDGEIGCVLIGPDKVGGVKIAADSSSPYSSIIYISKPDNNAEVSEVVKSLRKSIEAAAERLKRGEVDSSQAKAICTDCGMKPMIEEPVDPGIPAVYITAPFPEVNLVDGGVQFVTINLNDEYHGLPQPLPDGVSPADILKARDPKRMAACTAAWYRVYVTMVGDCTRWLPQYSNFASCVRKSMDAYVVNVKEDCYRNYYF